MKIFIIFFIIVIINLQKGGNTMKKICLVLHYISKINSYLLCFFILFFIQKYTIEFILKFIISNTYRNILYIIITILFIKKYIKIESPYQKYIN